MAWSCRTAAAAALLALLALAPSGVAWHEHGPGAPDASHEDCLACHVQHAPAVEADGASAPSLPAPVARLVAAARPGGDRAADLGIRPTRGPPA